MQPIATLLIPLVMLMVWGFGFWILWKFYRALEVIGEELGEIKTILRLRLQPPERPVDR
jgi:hypothetical protein